MSEHPFLFPHNLLVDDMHRYIHIVLEVFLYKNVTLVAAQDSQAQEHHNPDDLTNNTELSMQVREAMGGCRI